MARNKIDLVTKNLYITVTPLSYLIKTSTKGIFILSSDVDCIRLIHFQIEVDRKSSSYNNWDFAIVRQ